MLYYMSSIAHYIEQNMILCVAFRKVYIWLPKQNPIKFNNKLPNNNAVITLNNKITNHDSKNLRPSSGKEKENDHVYPNNQNGFYLLLSLANQWHHIKRILELRLRFKMHKKKYLVNLICLHSAHTEHIIFTFTHLNKQLKMYIESDKTNESKIEREE